MKKKTEVISKENTIMKNSPSLPQTHEDMEIDSFLKMRQAFITKVLTICVEGQDYHVIKGKKSLAKGGAEKMSFRRESSASAIWPTTTQGVETLGFTSAIVSAATSTVGDSASCASVLSCGTQ